MTTGKKGGEAYREIDIDLIEPPDSQARLDIPEKELFELSESMAEIGLIHAIVLCKRNGKYHIVVGHRRWLAAKMINWKKIKAEVKELSDEQIAIMRATENLQREGLSPIEEGVIYIDLFDHQNLSIKMIAKKMGKAATGIKKRMDLLKMDDHLQKAIHKKQISVAVAQELHKIEDKKDLYHYLDIAIDSGVTSRVVSDWVEEYRKGIQYVGSQNVGPSPLPEIERPDKYFTMCQCCEGPMEYKDMHTLKVCEGCYKLILKVVDQGYFKEGGE